MTRSVHNKDTHTHTHTHTQVQSKECNSTYIKCISMKKNAHTNCFEKQNFLENKIDYHSGMVTRAV